MARKAVLTGGKRDEILNESMKLFFENGYEPTTVRMIMDRVGGEIGMIYHYFRSKEALFDCVVEKFFADYQQEFDAVIGSCSDPDSLIDAFLPLYTR
jgi:AcrR family transcriptional regulator